MGNRPSPGKKTSCNQTGRTCNITKPEAYQETLPDPDKVYKHFFENSDDMLCIAGLDGYFKLVNPAFEKLLGYSGDELSAKPFYDFIHPDDREENVAEVHRLSKGENLTYCEHRYKCKDSSYKWLAWTSHTVVDEGLVYAVARDISGKKELEDEINCLRKHFLAEELENKEAFAPFITRSKKMLSLFHYMEAVAKSQRPVLITGETGVGKELIVKVLHQISNATGELVSINIAGLDNTIFSDTLFGHKKGAYTSADTERSGLILRASGGTLHLDEIGDLNELSQIKLLRLLEEKTYYQLGSDIPVQSGTRIIASTNRDISELVSEGKFRQDLYYRLCTHHIHIPPLRERVEDISLLLDHFIEETSKSMDKKRPQLSRELVILLSSYNFPGNIRELEAMVHDAVAQHDTSTSFLDHFKRYIKQKDAGDISGHMQGDPKEEALSDFFGHFPTLKEAENYLVSDALRRSKGNQGIAAAMLGISRQALNRRLKRKE
ncbi:MAG: sigma 54-interacting transcriptional regulator [Nitrospiraceae bacterium]|nr:MAG: sigma 54-interacting transcriptional regulator [Nitrospiraceae bacterium]